MSSGVECFAALNAIPGLIAGFVLRDPSIDVQVPRDEAIRRLEAGHRMAIVQSGLGDLPVTTVSQVHGDTVVVCDGKRLPATCEADALVTTHRNVLLGIYVADCAAVFIADRYGRGIALVHSGRKGTECDIVSKAIVELCAATGAAPSDLVVQVSPCIGPPHYEVDFAATICSQATTCGVNAVFPRSACTASDLHRYFSYRMEKGKTGRHLAFAVLTDGPIRPATTCQGAS